MQIFHLIRYVRRLVVVRQQHMYKHWTHIHSNTFTKNILCNHLLIYAFIELCISTLWFQVLFSYFENMVFILLPQTKMFSYFISPCTNSLACRYCNPSTTYITATILRSCVIELASYTCISASILTTTPCILELLSYTVRT